MRPSSSLLRVPTEIAERILALSDPTTVAAAAQSCSFFRNIVYRSPDQHLWRSLFLARFDDPRLAPGLDCGSPAEYSWADMLQRRARSERLLSKCDDDFENLLLEERCFVLETLVDAVQHARPPYALKGPSMDLEWVQRLVKASNMLSSLEYAHPPRRDRGLDQELLARLHVYHGLTEEEKDILDAQDMRTVSCCFVYDLRKYGPDNLWGPYERDSRGKIVRWIHVDHIVNIISMNLEGITALSEEMRPPTGFLAAGPYSAPHMDSRNERDWAGVEGKWFRYLCFMDYRHLFAFNFSTSTETEPLNPSIFDEDDFREAIRLIELNLRISSVTSCISHPTRPILHFVGSSKGAHGNEARVEGSVRMVSNNHVRWHFVSIYDGEAQWSSEGIQVGGVGSATGVVGIWTGAYHSDRDPVGPFWLWKVNPIGKFEIPTSMS